MQQLANDSSENAEQLVSFINGFLSAMESLNSFTNHGATFYIEKIERLSGYAEALNSHLSGCIATCKEIAGWKDELYDVAKEHFGQFYERISELTNSALKKSDEELQFMVNMEWLLKAYMDVMNKLIVEGSKVFEVYLDCGQTFYECVYRDFLIDNSNGLFFIHFGFSD